MGNSRISMNIVFNERKIEWTMSAYVSKPDQTSIQLRYNQRYKIHTKYAPSERLYTRHWKGQNKTKPSFDECQQVHIPQRTCSELQVWERQRMIHLLMNVMAKMISYLALFTRHGIGVCADACWGDHVWERRNNCYVPQKFSRSPTYTFLVFPSYEYSTALEFLHSTINMCILTIWYLGSYSVSLRFSLHLWISSAHSILHLLNILSLCPWISVPAA